MGYLRISCLPSTISLLASVCLPICIFFVYVSVCASVHLEIHSPKHTNKITDVRALHVVHSFYIQLLPTH